MQINIVFIATAFLASVSGAMAVAITGFAGAGCTGTPTNTLNINSGCATLGGGSVRSVRYSGAVNGVRFFVSGGAHDNCSNGAQLTVGPGSGCVNAPAGFNWESVQPF